VKIPRFCFIFLNVVRHWVMYTVMATDHSNYHSSVQILQPSSFCNIDVPFLLSLSFGPSSADTRCFADLIKLTKLTGSCIHRGKYRWWSSHISQYLDSYWERQVGRYGLLCIVPHFCTCANVIGHKSSASFHKISCKYSSGCKRKKPLLYKVTIEVVLLFLIDWLAIRFEPVWARFT